MMANALLSRLDGVRQTGPNRWIAKCPAHDDRAPSLSIRELEDGRVLIHDFAGCCPADVLAAIGLRLSDLFHDKQDHHMPPTRSRVPLRDLVALLDHEALIVALVGADMIERKTIDAEDYDRLTTAVRRIGEVRDHVHA